MSKSSNSYSVLDDNSIEDDAYERNGPAISLEDSGSIGHNALNMSTSGEVSPMLTHSYDDDDIKDNESLMTMHERQPSSRIMTESYDDVDVYGGGGGGGGIGEMNFIMNDIKMLEEDDEEDAGTMFEGSSHIRHHSKSMPTGKWKKLKFYVCLSSYWFAYSAIMSAMTSIIWPNQINYIVGEELKEKYTGWMPLFGVLVSITTAPLAGWLSDHSKNKFGKRRVFIMSGTLVASLFLFLSAFPGHQIHLFIFCTIGVQFGINWGGGPFAGLMPDLVPRERFGEASGFLAFANALGNLFGLSGVALLMLRNEKGAPPPLLMEYLYLIIVLLLFTLPTLIGVRETPQTGFVPKLTVKRFFKSFHLPRDTYQNFHWVIITRFFQEMGVYSVLEYFQFYLKDVIHVENGALYASYLLIVIVVTSVPTSIIAGPLSDRYGRKLCVYISSGVMALCTLGFMLLSFKPSLLMVFVVGGLFGMGYGAYQAVDWALALDVLPENADIAKDMGIWHQSMMIPQALSPLISGLIIDSLKAKYSYAVAYTVVFSVTVFWFIMATIMIKPIQLTKKGNFIPLQKQIVLNQSTEL
ncbi:hypothetical protein SAMD00019534_077080 [Acytostelium subglobosum LB1]|uniref:hypothetical protein n=1 Tax=Acytostelium subglobosum LB1 TaxID=1410327 RepID=UPI000644EC3B|nr:hypothetical protein SAMD00019534_077080 [Acytostelium subglobosum LB1]GAM24533.1 hypothetical protein SAMD00019534_077080 [Acytostelium subglobosum LB1]|eukprot:XP_012752859.1 hypothetical protein SAMD00019534_077080 [Acytostelium subglobosum LB1]